MTKLKQFAWYAIFLLPVAGILPFLGMFIFSKGAEFTDLAVSHYPNALWIQQSLRQWGQIPLWSATILSGYPFAATPLSGLHYPPGWLALIFPQPFGLNLLVTLHLMFGGLGMFLMLRREGLGFIPAALGALAFEGMPKLTAHLGAGHVTLIYAVSWTPWLLMAQQTKRGTWWKSGAALGTIALADPRWAVLAAILWFFYGLRGWSKDARLIFLFDRAQRSVVVGLLAFGLAAALILPLFEYTRLSTRSAMTTMDNLTLSLPPVQLLGLLTPPLGSNSEWVLYPGGMIFALALLGLGLPAARKASRFWLFTALVALIYALGSNLPGLDLLARLPGLSLIRVPPRALFAGGLALAAAAAWTCQVILSDLQMLRKMGKFNPLLFLVGIAFFLLAMTGLGWTMTGQLPLRFAWGGLALTGALAIIFIARAGRMNARQFALFAAAWLLVDLVGSNMAGLEFKSSQVVVSSEVADFFRANANGSRIYSPSYSVPQQTAAAYGLELADGVDPLQLGSYSRFMSLATGVAMDGYSVTLPAMVNGDPAVDNVDAVPDPARLGVLRVGYVASAYDLDVEGLLEVARFGDTRVYRNESVMPEAWVQEASRPAGEEISGEAEVVRTPNWISADASGPGMLVFSEVVYPGWSATLDGKPTEIRAMSGLLRAVYLPDGPHHVNMVYQPVMLYAGIALSFLTWVGVTILWQMERRQAGRRMI